MDNFSFQNPTKIVFGRGAELKAGAEAARHAKKVFVIYGGGSVRKTGLLGRVLDSLRAAGVEAIELGGVEPNPRLGLVHQGIELCRKEKVGLVLAVGGGSAIDSAKAIAMGVPYSGDVWDFFAGKARLSSALPVGTVLTIPAAGSEASTATVISHEELRLKRGFNSSLIYPAFSLLNPELAFTLPPAQAANGVADIMCHLMERYFTNTRSVELTDRLIEATLRAVIDAAPRVLRRMDDYDAWAQIMWSGTLAHNNLLDTGRESDWASHDIEHELSMEYDIAHGAGLAVVFPAWMKYSWRHDSARFAQFAHRVWGVEHCFQDEGRGALLGIERLEAFWASLGLATRLGGLGIGDERFRLMAERLSSGGSVGHFLPIGKAEAEAIYRLAL